jgi:hypothetical protein
MTPFRVPEAVDCLGSEATAARICQDLQTVLIMAVPTVVVALAALISIF